MIIDGPTGTVLTPGNQGRDCLGDGLHLDSSGETIECCCDECDYLCCCVDRRWQDKCGDCLCFECPRNSRHVY